MWSNKKLKEALKVRVTQNISAGKIVIDSRIITNQDIFLCLKGENFDGHDFKKEAISKGASIIIAEKSDPEFTNYEVIVENSYEALLQLARYKRLNSQAKFIAITGSVGKTTFKEALKSVLAKYDNSFATKGNFNNHIGMPLCLANLDENTKYAIFELGMNHAGEIEFLSNILKPDLALITQITEAHIGNFSSIDGIIAAKAEICSGFSDHSKVILNHSDVYYDKLKSYINDKFEVNNDNIHSFGCKSDFIEIRDLKYVKTGISLNFKDKIDYTQKFSFFHQALAELLIGIFAILKVLKLDFPLASNVLEEFKPIEGRGNIEEYVIKDIKLTVINDSYNANFTSMSESIKTLAKLQKLNFGRKVLIIGDMLELGSMAKTYHQQLAEVIKLANISKVIAIGDLMKNLYDILPIEMKLKYYTKLPDNLDVILNELAHDDLILIKSSKAIGTHKIIDYIKEQSNVI